MEGASAALPGKTVKVKPYTQNPKTSPPSPLNVSACAYPPLPPSSGGQQVQDDRKA